MMEREPFFRENGPVRHYTCLLTTFFSKKLSPHSSDLSRYDCARDQLAGVTLSHGFCVVDRK